MLVKVQISIKNALLRFEDMLIFMAFFDVSFESSGIVFILESHSSVFDIAQIIFNIILLIFVISRMGIHLIREQGGHSFRSIFSYSEQYEFASSAVS